MSKSLAATLNFEISHGSACGYAVEVRLKSLPQIHRQ